MPSGVAISQQKILAASQGDSSALREVLEQFSNTTGQLQTVTGTQSAVTKTSSPSSNRVSSARVPAQANGSVSVLNRNYVIQLVNPGGKSPISKLQAAEAAGSATATTNLESTTTIYHQLQASTSPAFNVNSNTQTFGGDTGSVQTLWTLTGLGSGTWYFRFRSSYDGINFNIWKNANGGSAAGGITEQVTVLTASYTDWALFELPGSLMIGVGAGVVPDQGTMGIPSGYGLYSSGLIAIAGPNGSGASSNSTYGITACDIKPEVGGGGAVGILDYPLTVSMKWGYPGYQVGGYASVFGISFDPSSDKIKLYQQGTTNGATWARLQLPGGARISIGQGRNLHGQSIWIPPEMDWFDSSRMMSICCLTDQLEAPPGAGTIQGFYECKLDGTTMKAQYQNDTGGAGGPTLANWMAIAWESGSNVHAIGDGQFLTIPLQGKHAVVLGIGHSASGASVTLPSGYDVANSLSICTPASAVNAHHRLAVLQQCSFVGLVPTLIYSSNADQWTGNCNWMIAAWK